MAEAVGDRLGQVRNALDGLVSGTQDDAQADAVAETLDEALPQRARAGTAWPGGGGGAVRRGPGGSARADLDELAVELQEGQSLVAVAESQGRHRAVEQPDRLTVCHLPYRNR